jgi:hypothetical protein
MMEMSAGTPTRASATDGGGSGSGSGSGSGTPKSRSGRFELVMTGDYEREPLLVPRSRQLNLDVVLACVYSFLLLTVLVGIVLWGLKTAENRGWGDKTR